MSSSTPVTALGALRAAVGVGAWLAPRTTGGLFGLAVNSQEAVLMTRLFSVRMTGGTLVQAGVACDVAAAAAATGPAAARPA